MDSINPIRLGGGGVHSTTNFRYAKQPTSTLSPLNLLATRTTEQIKQDLQNLHHLYFPPEPAAALFHASKLSISRRRNVPRLPVHDILVLPDSGYASAEEGDDDDDNIQKNVLTDTDDEKYIESDSEADTLRADPFERSFVIKWLTGFISRSDKWISACNSESESESEERSDVLDQAITLLSAFTSVNEETEVALTRTFSFPLTTSSSTAKQKAIHVELNDAPLSKEDHTSVGLQSWGSSILLAERICLQPSLFSLTTTPTDITNTPSRPLRILELGAGTGMLSIVAAKILLLQSQSYKNPAPAPEIIATDYHPEVLDNLSRNVATNFPTKHSGSTTITIKYLDWEVPNYCDPLDRPFDVILAADVIYHPEHAKWIKQCVEKLLVRPSADNTTTTFPCNRSGGGGSGGVFWLIIPVRSTGRHEGLDRTVDDLFSTYTTHDYEHHVEAAATIASSDKNSYEPKLAILQKEEVGRQGNIGRADEGGYKLFKIGWIV